MIHNNLDIIFLLGRYGRKIEGYTKKKRGQFVTVNI